MNTSRPVWRAALVGVALSVVLVLLLAPPTGWLARQQFAAVGFHLPQSDQQREADEAARRQHDAHRFPNDMDVQIAAALDRSGAHVSENGVPGDVTVSALPSELAALHALVPRFGSQPALYATLLRYEVGSSSQDGSSIHSYGVYLSRPEDWMLGNVQPSPETKYKSPDPAALATWDADCAAGERLDPQNVFFPMMRAVGLFAAYRDKEAINAVLRAGQKPIWNDYSNAEMDGRLRLSDSTNGGHYALGRVAIVSSTLFPHFSLLRAVARVATVKAMQMEQAGNVEEGLALRRALMTVSDHMRVQSTSIFGSLVAIAIAAIAVQRPGGAPTFKDTPPAGLPETQSRFWRATHRTEQFAAYATRMGHPELADLARAQEVADEAVHAQYKQAQDRALYNKLVPHAALWTAAETTLAVVLWLFLLGLAARLLARHMAFRESRPLHRPVKRGIGVAVLLALALAGYNGIGDPDLQLLLFFGSVLSAGLGAGILFFLRRRITRPTLGRFVQAFLITTLALAGATGIIFGQVHDIAKTWQDVRALEGMTSSNDGMQASTDLLPVLVTAAAVLALPLLTMLLFAIWGRARRVPVNVAIVRGFLSSSVPLASVLLLVWGGLCLHTLRQERALNAELDRMTAHEGRYYAALAGAEWPGPAIP